LYYCELKFSSLIFGLWHFVKAFNGTTGYTI
jgi:hypothetical protein